MLILENVFNAVNVIFETACEAIVSFYEKYPEYFFCIVISITVFLFGVSTCRYDGYKYDPDWKDEKTVLQYREANLWEEPMQKGHVGVAHMYETFQTTGHRYYFSDADDVFGCDYWEEVILEDGSTAWIIGSAF